MITQKNLRSLLPGKIARVVTILSEHTKRPPIEELKAFYASPVYANLEREETKYWWLSPEQLADLVLHP